MNEEITSALKVLESRTAWRIEGTLREFPKFNPINLWFDYPIHKQDASGVLKNLEVEGECNSRNSPFKKNFSKKKSPEEAKQESMQSLETAFSGVAEKGKSTVKDLAEYLGVSEKTVRNRIKSHGGFWIDDGEIGLKGKENVD
jgi:regulatory protein RepA